MFYILAVLTKQASLSAKSELPHYISYSLKPADWAMSATLFSSGSSPFFNCLLCNLIFLKLPFNISASYF